MEGNQMKMREALVLCSRIIGANGIRGNVFLDDIQEAHKAITDALAAPPRQCDVGTPQEQYNRFREFCLQYTFCEQCQLRQLKPEYDICGMRCGFKWAQMPYEKQEGAGE